MDCSPPGSSIQGIFQARILEWGATAFSMFLDRKLKKRKNSTLFMGKALSRHVLGDSNTHKRVKTYFSQELSNYQLHLDIILIT